VRVVVCVSRCHVQENENYLQSQGLNNDPHQSVFDLLGHELPKPLPKPEPCTFCRPPRDNPPEYYNIDYTVRPAPPPPPPPPALPRASLGSLCPVPN
jgi:hypothetical protein